MTLLLLFGGAAAPAAPSVKGYSTASDAAADGSAASNAAADGADAEDE
jgi:hypothetical protein